MEIMHVCRAWSVIHLEGGPTGLDLDVWADRYRLISDGVDLDPDGCVICIPGDYEELLRRLGRLPD